MKRAIVGFLAVVIIVIARYAAPPILALVIGLAAWASEPDRIWLLLILVFLCLGALGTFVAVIWDRTYPKRTQ